MRSVRSRKATPWARGPAGPGAASEATGAADLEVAGLVDDGPHQERYDGRGYPRGLKGKEIPLGESIFSVVDTLDAMTSDRPCRRAVPFEAARAELLRHSGTQVDPQVVRMVVAIPDEEWRAIHRQFLQDIMAREGRAA